jgi:hypothetical protein
VIFCPQEAPGDLLALSKMDCQQHSCPAWLMNPAGDRLDKILWRRQANIPTRHRWTEAPERTFPGC